MPDIPAVPATCARCPAPVEVTEETQRWQEVFNAELNRRKNKPLGINELALCDDCYPGWKAEREAVAAELRERVHRASMAYRADVAEHGERVARGRIPASLRGDADLSRLTSAWLRWWKDEGQNKRSKGRSF